MGQLGDRVVGKASLIADLAPLAAEILETAANVGKKRFVHAESLGACAYFGQALLQARMHSALRYRADMRKNKPLMVVVGENVKALMLEKKMSQPKVAATAAKLGTKVDQTTVSRVANAVYPATVDTLEAVANGLGVEPWRLFMPSNTDEKFLAILKAWSVSSEIGRDLILSAATVAMEKYGAASTQRDSGK